MAVWTVFAIWAYDDRRRRGPLLLVADLAVAVGAILVSPVLKGDGLSATVPAFWVMGALLAWAIHWRWLGGLVAAASHHRRGPGDPRARHPGQLRQRLPAAHRRADRRASWSSRCSGWRPSGTAPSATRRPPPSGPGWPGRSTTACSRCSASCSGAGRELGGEAAELGRLAGEQEVALRTLIREQDQVAAGAGRPVDLAAALVTSRRRPGRRGRHRRIRSSCPPRSPASWSPWSAACLDNVARHVGPDARAWVLLEGFPDRVEISVRDEGPGIPEGRLEAAAADGRLGVSQSIRGRVADLGGRATLTTGADGTEWEFVVPVVLRGLRRPGLLRDHLLGLELRSGGSRLVGVLAAPSGLCLRLQLGGVAQHDLRQVGGGGRCCRSVRDNPPRTRAGIRPQWSRCAWVSSRASQRPTASKAKGMRL